MNVGDTIQYLGSSPYEVDCQYLNNYILDSVTIEFIAGKFRTIQNFTAFDSSFYNVSGMVTSKSIQIVEGIGSINSHLFPHYNHHCYLDQTGYGFCEFQEDNEIYNPSGEECDWINSNKNISAIDIEIVPSITTSTFKVKNINEYRIEAYTSNGVRLKIENTNDNYRINSNYTGVIFLRIIKENSYVIKRIVKI
jgi:hypothetical protein